MKKILSLLLTLTMSIAAWAEDPYYEIVSGSLSSYTITLKVTFPDATSVNPYFMTNYAANLYNKNNLLMAYKRNNTGVQIDGNSFIVPLDVYNRSEETDDLTLVLEKFSVKVDGSYITSNLTINQKKAAAAEPTYFWVKNISGSSANLLLFPDMNIEYTKDPKNGWNTVNRYWTVVLANDEKVYLRTTSSDANRNVTRPYSAEFDYAIGGDITTLLVPEGNLDELPEIIDGPSVFGGLFWSENYLVDASELILPSTKLSSFCYESMFFECVNLTAAPVLPAFELAPFCYANMFLGCSKLNHVTAYFTDWGTPDDMCTQDWLTGTAPNGIFQGHDWVAQATQYVYGCIPDGWTAQPIASMDITVPDAGYTTFYYEKNWVMPEGMEGYLAIDEYDYRTGRYEFLFEKVFEAGDIISSHQPLVLKANAGTYTINFTDEPTEGVLGSSLGGSVMRVNLADEFYYNHSEFYWYALSHDADGKNAGYYWVNEDGSAFTSAPFQAWLHVSSYQFDSPESAIKSYIFDDILNGTTAINTVAAPSRTDSAVYDLLGRRVNSTNAKGIYVINGKKVVK